jgi:site-specific recombinase XerD
MKCIYIVLHFIYRVKMKILKDLLGHSVINTTMIYSHVGDKVMAEAVVRMDEEEL